MANITSPRDNGRIMTDAEFSDPVKAGEKLIKGAMYGIDASGYAVSMESGVPAKARGEVMYTADNTNGGDGDLNVRGRSGIFKLHISGSSLSRANIGDECFAVDNQTVHLSSDAGARPSMGRVVNVESGYAHVAVGPMSFNFTSAAAKKGVMVCPIDSMATGGVFRFPLPDEVVTITKLKSIINGALTTGNATITAAINAANITGGVITVAQSGSAAGDQDEAVPSAANVSDGADDYLKLTLGGTNDATVTGVVLVEYTY